MVKEEGPDQARSWAIAVAACVINTMLSGISRTTGLIYVALIETYGVSRLQANFPFTMRNIVRNLSGPLVGAIGQRYGPRDVTIAGGVMAALGILLCTFAPDITWITILWGGMHGLGVAFGNTLFQILITQYFVKYRATASGLAISGACVGSFVFPILIEYTLLKTGLKGTFLITGGLMLNVLPASLLMVEPSWIKRETKTANSRNNPALGAPKQQKLALTKTMGSIPEESSGHHTENKNVSVIKMTKISSSICLSRKPSGDAYNNGKSRNDDGIDNPVFGGSKTDLADQIIKNPSFSSVNKTEQLDVAGSKLDLTSKGTEQELNEADRNSRLRAISIGEISMSVPVTQEEVALETSVYKAIIKVCCDPMFHMISISLAAFAMLFDPAITVIVDYIMDKGLTEEVAKYFISMLAFGDLIGRLCFGWVTDKKYLSIPTFMMLLQIVQGICFLLLPLLYSFDVLMTVIVIYGLASGATLVMFPILVAKYLQSVQSMAIGSIQFLSGLLSFAIPPIVGYFRDQCGSYDGMFYITGGLSVFAGIAWLLEPLLLKLRTKLNKERNTSLTTTTA